MRLVDTSAWVEFLTGSPLGTALASELPDRTQWLVPNDGPIGTGEVADTRGP